jgi:hypothetical protein
VFGVLRGFTFLARDVFEAALYLIPAPGLSGDDVDGADVLAERARNEARVDLSFEYRWPPRADSLSQPARDRMAPPERRTRIAIRR